MTIFKRLFSSTASSSAPVAAVANPVALGATSAPSFAPIPTLPLPVLAESNTYQVTHQPPDWLTDEKLLRDEGVLFGLTDAQPDQKMAEITAYFSQQTAPLEAFREQCSERIDDVNSLITQRKANRTDLLNRIKELRDRQPAQDNLVRTLISLGLSAVMSVGTFFLVDDTLQPAFPNRWVAVGVYLAGMFSLFGRQSFFYEEGSKVSGRRLIEEIGLPLAASVFVLVQALQTKSVWQAFALFIFIFFLFLLAGKLLLSTLTTLRHDLANIQANRQLLSDKEQLTPVWEAQADQIQQEINLMRTQVWPIATALSQADADLAQMNAQRDRLVNLFLSEFELARSLRDRLSESQRTEVLQRYNVM
ncbi:hypothetical protein GCM10027341_54260 [Spirosoma knui]